MRSVVIAALVLLAPACSPCAFGFCSDVGGEGEGEGEGSEGEGEGAQPPTACNDAAVCLVVNESVGTCRQDADCGRSEACVAVEGIDVCVVAEAPGDPPCAAPDSESFTASSTSGQQVSFCANPTVNCNNGACVGGNFGP